MCGDSGTAIEIFFIGNLRKPISFMFNINVRSHYLVITRKNLVITRKLSRDYEKRSRDYEKRSRDY